MNRYFLVATLALFCFTSVHALPIDNPKADNVKTKKLPLAGLLPKGDTGADVFIKKYPKANGTGTIVAIFDTGVDPGVEGLLTTPDGRPKIVDLVDGTGSGDVITKTVRKPNDKNRIVGLSGRTLKLGKWKNPKNEYRLGLKAAYDFFPSDPGRGGALVERLQKETNIKWLEKQQRRRDALEVKLLKAGKANKDEIKKIKAQLELLKSATKTTTDPGPIFDCLVFHDGKQWQAVIDTDEDGDLAEEKVLTNYRNCRKYGTFAEPANLNFAVNIYENGNLLSIVADSGRHGTHVAGIVAAYYPGHPELNGVAPGTQIVSVKIGDTRLFGMETGAGLERGIRAVLDNKCDLINMSYGESTTAPNQGWLTRQLANLVTENGIIFVSSAGNSGPTLTTVGGIGGTTSEIIGVGAYVSAEMAKAEYTLRKTKPGLPYIWTSRGPTADGDIGVDIFAPGGAVAPIPQWSLQKSEQLNGTSMASPNACGNIALMLSAAKQEKIKYTPASVRRALQNTAVVIDAADRFGQGAGLIQVQHAYEALKANFKQNAEEYAFNVRFPRRNNARGLYLRESHETNGKVSTRVSVNAVFPEKTPNDKKIKFDLRLNFQTKASWVSVGEFMLLTHGSNTFDIEVHPETLQPGVHFTEIVAYEAGNKSRGVLFTIPITVTKLHSNKPLFAEKVEIENGTLIRRYFAPPTGTTWARLRMVMSGTSTSQVVRFHSMQLLEGAHFEKGESSKYFRLTPNQPVEQSFPIVEGRTLEVCLNQYWSDVGEGILDYEIEFFGAKPSKEAITIAQGDGTQSVEIRSHLRTVHLDPHASFNTLRKTYLPTSTALRPLDRTRYTTAKGESIYEQTIHYAINLANDSSVSIIAPRLHDLLYDSPVSPYHFTIRNTNGKLVHTNDMFPDTTKLPKGKYKIALTLHHHNPEAFEQLKKLPLCFDFKLAKPINTAVYNSPKNAAVGKAGLAIRTLKVGQSYRLYVGEPSAKSIPKIAQAGDQLLGSISYINEAFDTKKAKATRPGGYPIRYLITTGATPKATTAGSSPLGKGKTTSEKLKKGKQSFVLKQLKALTKENDLKSFNALFEKAIKKDPKNRKLLVAKLHRLDDTNKKKRLEAVIKSADNVINSINQTALATYFGTRHPQEKAADKATQKKREAEKAGLIDALYRKARAIAYRELPDVIKKTPIEDQKKQNQQFENACDELSKWVDLKSKKYFLLEVRKERRKGNFAQALLLLNKNFNAKQPEFKLLKKQRDLYKELGWKDFQQRIETQLLKQFPKKRPPY